MNLTKTEHTVRTVVLAPSERIDAFSAPALRSEIDALLDEGERRLVIDLSAVPFLDSAGMAVLVSALKRTRQAGGDTKLVWPEAEAARRILHLTKFDRVFDIADTAEGAITRFSP